MSAAGFYHCSVKGVGRANGRSIVAAAAYRSGERLIDERTGQIADYRARGGVEETFILARDDAPEWAHDRQRLWNEVERAEPRANGRLATELELALPHELDAAARRALVQDFLAPIIAKHGIAADVAIHAPGKDGDHRNHHAHVLLTHRELGPEGFGEIANTRTVTRKRKGREVQEQVAGIAATPADIKAIRKDWEEFLNRAYERAGLDIRADHRSHKDRGLTEEPTKHLGPDATALERQGEQSDRGDLNREIEERNEALREQAQLEIEAVKAAADLAAARMLAAMESAAARITEPFAPIWDRDADNAEWEARLADAALDADRTATEAHQEPAAAKGRETRARVEKATSGPENAPAAAPQSGRPLNRVQAKIREALDGADSAQAFADALKDRGFILAEVRAPELQRRDAHELKALLEMKANGVWMLAEDHLTPEQTESARESYDAWIANQPKDKERKPFGFESYVSYVQGRNQERLAELQEAAATAPQRAEDQSKDPILPRYAKGGDLVVVDQRGSIYALNRRVTGRDQKEFTRYLADIDRTQLMSVTDAQTVMRVAKEQQRIARAQARINAPLNKTAAAIRAAWEQSWLDKSLAARGFSLAVVTAAEAAASRQKNAEYRAHQEARKQIAATGKFADLRPKQAVRYAPVLKEGQIVAVNRFGVYCFDERTTGQMRPEIDARLAAIDRDGLRSITDTQAAMRTASLEAWRAERRAERAQKRINAPLGKTAAEIRTAWNLSRDADPMRAAAQFEDALSARGLSLAAVSAAEADASRARRESTAKGRYADLRRTDARRYEPVFTTGEIVAVDGRGFIHRLDEYTTGQMRPEIEARLVTINRAALLNVADTIDAMKAASLEAWKAERRAEREKVRPANWVEQKIADCARDAKQFGALIRIDKKGQRVTGADRVADKLRPEDERQLEGVRARTQAEAFAARLDDAGIAIVRVTAADVQALAALRHDEAMKQQVAQTNAESNRTGNRFADVLQGDLAAVTRKGDVYKINPDKMHGAASFLPLDLPSVVEARAAFEIDTERTEKLYADRRAEGDAKRASRETWREIGRAAFTAKKAVHATYETPASATRTAIGKVLGFAGAAVKLVSSAFSLIPGGAMAEPKKTAQQHRDEIRAATNPETLHAKDYDAHVRGAEAEHDYRMEAQKRAQQEGDLRLARTLGIIASTEPDRSDDERPRQRERERDRY